MTAVHVCPAKDIECGMNPQNWCMSCSKWTQVAVAPNAAAHAYPTVMRPATPDDVLMLSRRFATPASVEDAIRAARNSAFEAAAIEAASCGHHAVARRIRAMKDDSALGVGVGAPAQPSRAALDAAWQAFESHPVDHAEDHDDQQRLCVEAAVRAAYGVPAGDKALPLFAVGVARRKWESLQADGYRMQRIQFARSIDGHERRGSIDPWGKVLWEPDGVKESQPQQEKGQQK